MRSLLTHIFFTLALWLFFSCTGKRSVITSTNETNGKLVDYTGLDGCRWMIETNDAQVKFDPINLDQFGIEKKNGANVIFTYKEVQVSSICMAGKTIELVSIKTQ